MLEPTEGPVLEARKIAQAASPSTRITGIETGTPAEIALWSSQVFFDSAQFVILASSTEKAAQLRAASFAVTVGAPMLLTAAPGENIAGQDLEEQQDSTAHSGSLNTELLRLGTRALITVGDVSLHQLDTTSLVVRPLPESTEEIEKIFGVDLNDAPAPAPADEMAALAALKEGRLYTAKDLGPGPSSYGTLPQTLPAGRNPDLTVLSESSTRYYAGIATARAAGADVFIADDPGTRPAIVTHISQSSPAPVIGFGEHLQNERHLNRIVSTLQTGMTLPTGAQRVFQVNNAHPRVVLVDGDELLKQDGVDGAGDVLDLARTRATDIAGLTDQVFSGAEVSTNTNTAKDLTFWVAQTREADQYLTLRVRGGGNLVDNVRGLQAHLVEPHVGIRIDLGSAGTVDAEQINDVVTYVRNFVRQHNLPQKLVIIDLGADTAITNPDDLAPSSTEVAVTVSIDPPKRGLTDETFDPFGREVFLATTITAVTDEDEERTYPDLKDVLKGHEINLMTYR